MSYRTVIGLEIHVELLTKSKIFCSCSTEFGSEPNTQCCPVCLGLPGALPVLNKKVVEYCIKAGLALNCHITNTIKMDRKNYFYPDLVKGYQITQYNEPLCRNGYVEIDIEKDRKKVRIRRIHIEEDTGKSIHLDDDSTLIDYNRSGVPLIEIVTEPDISSPGEASLFLEKLKSILKYIGVSDCKMEEGSLRCDININVVEEKTGKTSEITEIKNLNSFKSVVRALEYEEKRHIKLLNKGLNTKRETRRWNEDRNETIMMRTKEDIEDYRYFRESDIVEIDIDPNWTQEIKQQLPELPHIRKERFIREYKIPEYDAEIITKSKELADYYEETVKYVKNPKQVSNWIMGDVLRKVKEKNIKITSLKIKPKDLAQLIKFINSGSISNNIAREVLNEMFNEGKSPEDIIKNKELTQINDESILNEIIDKILNKNEKSVEDYLNGKNKALGFLVGQVMKATKGKANPILVNRLLLNKICKKKAR
jgi:aspartyl-tRNA(Asn)/glutamyl-tRNA(Gln) amidotransferase subunit B